MSTGVDNVDLTTKKSQYRRTPGNKLQLHKTFQNNIFLEDNLVFIPASPEDGRIV